MEYRIQSGDTMGSIAAKFNVSLAVLEAANPQIANLNLINTNELVNVPSPAAPTHQPSPVPAHVVTYVVQTGDTMSSIAAAHNLSLAALEAANPKVTNADSISPGQVHSIPGGATPVPPAGKGGPISIGAVTYGRYDGGGEVSTWTTQACG